MNLAEGWRLGVEVVQLSKQLDLGRAEQVQANMPPGGLADERRGAGAGAVEDNASLPSSKLSSEGCFLNEVYIINLK